MCKTFVRLQGGVMIAKIRPNVMAALICGSALTGLFGWWLIDRLHDR